MFVDQIVTISSNLKETGSGMGVVPEMVKFAGRTATITRVGYSSCISEMICTLDIDHEKWSWQEWMFESPAGFYEGLLVKGEENA